MVPVVAGSSPVRHPLETFRPSYAEAMIAILIVVGIVAVCVLAAVYGTDSRHVDTGHPRRNL